MNEWISPNYACSCILVLTESHEKLIFEKSLMVNSFQSVVINFLQVTNLFQKQLFQISVFFALVCNRGEELLCSSVSVFKSF